MGGCCGADDDSKSNVNVQKKGKDNKGNDFTVDSSDNILDFVNDRVREIH